VSFQPVVRSVQAGETDVVQASVSKGDQIDVDENARLALLGRKQMVRRVVASGHTPEAVSQALGVCPRTVRKWVTRFRAERIEALRRQRWTGKQIALLTAVSPATSFATGFFARRPRSQSRSPARA
jgi:hypothetical protein